MAELVDQALELIAKLPEDQRPGLEAVVKGLNQEKGKAKGDISKLKADFDGLKTQLDGSKEKESAYKQMMDVFGKVGIKAEDASKALEKLNIAKTIEDENIELKRLVKESTDKVQTFEEKQKIAEFKQKMDPVLEKALENLKDKDGNKVHIAPDFINREELYKTLDLDSEPLVNDRLTKVLQAAQAKQESFLKANSLDFTRDVHKVNTGGDKHFSGDKEGIDLNKINESSVKAGGSIESVAQAMAQIRAQREKEKG